MTFIAIRDGMKTRLDTISGLSAHNKMPDSFPDKDVAVVLPGSPVIEPDGHVNGYGVNLRVFVRCSRGKLKDSQEALDAYIWPTGTNSIKAAVDGDRTLSGTVHDTRFVGVTQYAGEEKGFAVSAEVLFFSRALA